MSSASSRVLERCRSFLESQPWEYRYRKRSFEASYARWVSETGVWGVEAQQRALPEICFEVDGSSATTRGAWRGTLGCILVQTWPLTTWRLAKGSTEPSPDERRAIGLPDPGGPPPAAASGTWVVPVSVGDLLHPSLAGNIAMAVRDGARAVAWDYLLARENESTVEPTLRVRGAGCDPLSDAVLDRRLRAFALPDVGRESGGLSFAEKRLRFAPFPEQWHVIAEPLSIFPVEPGQSAFLRRSADAELLSRIWGVAFGGDRQDRLPLPAHVPPRVSIIILFRDRHELTARALESVQSQRFDGEIELVLVDNQSTPRSLEQLRGAVDRLGLASRTRWVAYPHAFNHSRQCIAGVEASTGQVLLFLNNDAAFLEDDAVDRLARWAMVPGVASVGAGIEDADGRPNGGGFVARANPGHEFNSPVEEARFPIARLTVGNTFACAAVSRTAFHAVGGLDPIRFPIGFNDVDYCLRASAAGWRHVNLPDVRVVHEVGASRVGTDEIAQKVELRRRHPWVAAYGLQEPREEPLPTLGPLPRSGVPNIDCMQGATQ